MKFYHITEEPIKIYGLAVMDREKRQFWRVTPEIMEALPQYEFLGKRAECTVDGTHPNSLGFMRMAEKIYPVMKEALEA